ncbi:polyprenol phosphomannose-dependent alpha 1,6 mannosyltransferase MptB, partial [Streptomyces sp. NPDC003362]
MASSVDLRRCQILGLAGTAVLALGGETAGALPVRDVLSPASAAAALGLVGVYFGVVLLIAAWALLGRLVRGPRPPTPRTLLLVLAVWAAPLLLAPPLFSRDVYSYLAQGAMVDARIDVYTHGPSALGGPLADEVAPLWQHTAAPYGPVFLAVASALSGVTRGELPAGLMGMRLVALLGVALMAAALPRLARHSGADPAAALWLGALNPLVLLHLVAGAHNDAMMLGLLGVGLVAALGRRPVLGTVLVTLAALVKAPAVLGLAAVVLLRTRAGRRPVPAVLTTAGAAAATTVAGAGGPGTAPS